MTKHMSDEEFRARLIRAVEWLIGVAKHYSADAFFGATVTQADGSVWQVVVQPGTVPAVGITTPQPVIFSLN